ncbi:DUF4294 domain-containing protein [Chitinophaga cymbidii]|uniref:DUF4294 domain-containing protein n=1 Tax=Chitinophaga cymbidii TaxID=1096750 RepID=A0A512RR56_9BACT|nr:DUF4294 domain-containing protein [Chitinophaga cymbidii]GEP98191.1 hypothetical protein CCY01nite_44510 [Chitinophaga cymbidii]
MLRIPIITALCVLCLVCTAAAQQRNGADSVAVRAVMNGTQLMPSITLPIVEVVDRLPKRLRKERERWTRLRNAVYVTYPYARSAGRVLKDVNQELNTFSNKKQRKAYLSSKEKELKTQFGDKLENLSVYQGKVLMKLIHRETGENCYEIIRELKGGFNARVYQTVAFFFGGNLKSEFNSRDDRDIEMIIEEIELYRRFY